MSCRYRSVRFSSKIRGSFVVLLFLTVLTSSCGHKESGPPPHFAFVGFENISGDAALDWVSRGSGEFLSRSLRGLIGDVLSPDAIARASQTLGARPATAPGISAARTAAVVAGANHVIGGYIERTAAGVRITASEEDIVTHKTDRTLSATAGTPFEALKLLAGEFSAKAGAPLTSSPEAFRLYSTALDGLTTDAAPLLNQALALDPDFGRAWLALARTSAATGDRNGALAVIKRARAQKIAPLDRAWLDFEDAALNGDKSASLEAMRKVWEFDPGDTSLARNLATTEIAAGNFSLAAAVWKKLTTNAPGDVDAWNQLAYALCWSGDYAGALAAARQYAVLRPSEANPSDTQGDIHYWFGKFGDAAASYAAAYAKMPAFLNGGELYKSAWAKFLAGDKTGADALFAKFRAVREKANDPSVLILAGDWLYRTGRQKDARELLQESARKESGPASAAIRIAVAGQLTVWDLLERNRAAAATDVAQTGPPTSTGDVLLRFITLPSAPASEWDARAAHLLATPQLTAIRPVALGYALILDGKKDAALPLWEEIANKSPDDFFARNMVARLKGQAIEHAVPPDPSKLNEFAAVPEKI